jgi:hypothetical protein
MYRTHERTIGPKELVGTYIVQTIADGNDEHGLYTLTYGDTELNHSR